ncbi:carbon storage regulator CsrA [Kurthia massiliensis]|uniref:carbon storage regulator CsrA n=1 Tax=Kurthia massiliensis TaxID=1033739 RepID=UPI00028926A0|nr:carbon storage regulator CsrA [Kurthia massiliensis]
MLVLTRKPGETVMLGEDIQVKVVSIDGDQVKIGIEAPRSLKIFRKELYEEIQKENKAALETQNLSVLDGWQ